MKFKESNKYFWCAIGCIVLLFAGAGYSIYLFGMKESEFVLGASASAIGALIGYLFGLSANKIAQDEKKTADLNNIIFELTVNYNFLNEWYEKTKTNWTVIVLNRPGFNAHLLLKTDSLRSLDINDLSQDDINKIINYISMIESIKSGTQVTSDFLEEKVAEAKDMISIIKALV